MNENYYDLNCKFDMVLHKAKYPHYLEVIIDKDGEVLYAVPSHQEKLIAMMQKKFNITRNEVIQSIPKEYWFDVVEYLCSQLECLSVWTNFVRGNMNHKQYVTLRKLKMHGVYEGQIPNKNKGEGI